MPRFHGDPHRGARRGSLIRYEIERPRVRGRFCCVSSSNIRAAKRSKFSPRDRFDRTELRTRHDRHLRGAAKANAGRATVHFFSGQERFWADPPSRSAMGQRPRSIFLRGRRCLARSEESRRSDTRRSGRADGRCTAGPARLCAIGRQRQFIEYRHHAREPRYMPLLRRELTPERIVRHLEHLVSGPAERFEAPGLHALNFVIATRWAAAAWPRFASTRKARLTGKWRSK